MISVLQKKDTDQSIRAKRLQFDKTKLKEDFTSISLSTLEDRLSE